MWSVVLQKRFRGLCPDIKEQKKINAPKQVNRDYHGPKPKGKDRITKEVSSTFGRADS